MKNEIEKIKDQYEKFQKEYNQKTYNDCAKVIVGFKMMTHIIFKLPKAIKEKNSKSDNKNENPLYKNKSVFDYIEETNFEYNDEIERIANKIEQRVNVVDKTIKNIKQKTNPFNWIKKIIDGIRKNHTKLLIEGTNTEKELDKKSEFEETRHNFISSLGNGISINNTKGKEGNERIDNHIEIEKEL